MHGIFETDRIHQKVIGDSEIMKRLKSQVLKIARFPWPVMVLGESGVGKELIARSIHKLSLRGDMPFVPVNCAGMPDTLLESEFFGYEKGAFTDAKNHKTGKFHEAEGGTIFLDEIGEASLKLQLTLLRVLDTGRITRVGGVREELVSARIICATNKPVEDLMNEMRTDLFHRISAFPLYIQPLRERREDIPELAGHFIRNFREEFNSQVGEHEKLNISEIDTDALKFLMKLNLYGNVRELRNILQRSVMLSEPCDICITEKHVRDAVQLIPQPETDDIASESLRWIYEWALCNQSAFWNRHRRVNKTPDGGWAGRWDIKRGQRSVGTLNRNSAKNDLWEELCFMPKIVTRLLREGNFERKAVIDTWTDREWLSCNKKRSTKTCRIDGKAVPMYCFKRGVFEKKCNLIQINI
ncbi:sigma 54-interacting transcriptional regulator [Desulfonema magnum]|uniref:Transcriptional regulator, sigma54-dependent n=1 Tax=Desulfonema magnum TaxID=45655 RepID=A0A975BFR1_9BACT|nr:sigma 54-interacting transcriptional regulator [Desulfonema magnum]QTA84601.1 Transcriptional regulator, sigma54-dependent [Desulfonema magnum]